MGISTEDKYLIKSFPENKKYEAKRLLKCFLTKTSLSGLKALIKKVTTQVLWFDVLCSGRPHTVSTVAYVCVVNFLISAFSPSRLQFLLANSLSNRFAPHFLLSRKDLTKYLSSVPIPIDTYVINSKESVTNEWTILKCL